MTASRVALVAEDAALVRHLADYLGKALSQPIQVFAYASVRAALDREADGLLLLTHSSAAEQEAARQLVQDISLQKLPPLLVLLNCGNPPGENGKQGDLDLDRYVARHLHWPDEADVIVRLATEMARARGFCPERKDSLEDLLSRRLLAWTPSLLPLIERIALAARHEVTVLLNGETGTGKTFLARLVHEYSPRKHHRFLTVPCGALSANLVESEFFGHSKGAFTGADRPKVGKFAAVGHGTLLLDEIDTLGLEQQATLLRVMETGEFEPVGSIETQKCTGRLIVASNIDLEEAAERGKFRADLYFRLNVMSFHLPPLRERIQDIAPLARGMAARFNRKFAKSLYQIHPEAMAALEAYPWPGNLRQLENVVQHAVLVSSGPELLPNHLPEAVQDAAAPISTEEGGLKESLQHQRDVIERSVIQRALMANGYSRSRAADSLGISRVTLYKKMKKYGLMKLPLNPSRV